MRNPFILGCMSVCVGMACIIAALVTMYRCLHIVKIPTDAAMSAIDSIVAGRGLDSATRRSYEDNRDIVLSEYRMLKDDKRMTYPLAVFGMMIVGVYNLATGIALCRRDNNGAESGKRE